jgi:acetyltransferase-like isoleucine patch superfamily enzyme
MLGKLSLFLRTVLYMPLRPQSLGRRVYLLLRAIPKTIYFNFKYFRFRDAIRFPVWVSHRVHLMRMGGTVAIDGPVEFGMVRFGFAENNLANPGHDRCTWDVLGNVIFKNGLVLALGTKIAMQKKEGRLTFGRNNMFNANNHIGCDLSITFGDYLRVGWENLILDTPYHDMKANGQLLNAPAPIVIGNHVWITTRCGIFQGTELADGSVVSYGSVLSRKYTQPNSMIMGYPGKVVLEGVEHEEMPLKYYRNPEAKDPA